MLFDGNEALAGRISIAGPKLKELHAQKAELEGSLRRRDLKKRGSPVYIQPRCDITNSTWLSCKEFSAKACHHYAEAADKARNLIARVTVTPQDKASSKNFKGSLR